MSWTREPGSITSGGATTSSGISDFSPAVLALAMQKLVPTTVKTSAFNASPGNFIPCSVAGGSFTVTLPSAPADNSLIALDLVTASGTNAVTVAASGSDVFRTAGGPVTLSLVKRDQGLVLQYNASLKVWYVVVSDISLTEVQTLIAAEPDAIFLYWNGTTYIDGSGNTASKGDTSGKGKVWLGLVDPNTVSGTSVNPVEDIWLRVDESSSTLSFLRDPSTALINGSGINFSTDPTTGQITISAVGGTTTGTASPSKPTVYAPNNLRFFDAAMSDAANALVPIYIIGDSVSQGQGANGINVDDENGLTTGIPQWQDTWARDMHRRFVRQFGGIDPGEGVIISQDARWVTGGTVGTDIARGSTPTRLGTYGSGFAIITTSGSVSLPVDSTSAGVAADSAIEVEWVWRPGTGAPVVSWTNMGSSSAITPNTPGTARTANIAVATGRHTLTNHGFVVGDVVAGATLTNVTGITTSTGGFTNSYYEIASVIDANTFTISQDGAAPSYGGSDGTWSVAKVQWIKTIIPNPDTTSAGQNVIFKIASTATRAFIVQVRKLKTTVNSRGIAGYGTCGVQVNRMARSGYSSADLDGTGTGVTSSTSKNIIKRGTFTVGAQKVATGVSMAATLTQSTGLVTVAAGHGLKVNDRVTLDNITGVTNLDETAVYYVALSSTGSRTDFKLTTGLNGSGMSFTGANGTVNVTPRASYAGLLIIMLGANDYAQQAGTAGANRLGITPSAFEAYIRSVCALWVNAGGDVLLIGEMEHTLTASPATMQDYRDRLKLIAESTDHVACYWLNEVWGSSDQSHINGFQLPNTIHCGRAGYSDIARLTHSVLSASGRSRYYDPVILAPTEIVLPAFTGHITLTPQAFSGNSCGDWDLELGTVPTGYTPSVGGSTTLRQLIVNGSDVTNYASNSKIAYDATGGSVPRLIHTVGGDVKPSATTTKWDWPSHFSRARYKFPEKSAVAPAGAWRLVHSFGLPTGFYAAQDSYHRICNTDNYTTTLNGSSVGANDGNEMRVMFVIYSDHLPRLLVDHETKPTGISLWTGTTQIPEGDHIVDIFFVPSQTGTGSFYIKIDGVLQKSGQNMNTAPSDLTSNELVVTRVVAGSDGVADQDKPGRSNFVYTYQTDFYWV